MKQNEIEQSKSNLLGQVATELYNVEQIMEEVRTQEQAQTSLTANTSDSVAETPFVSPRTPTERKLAEMWAESLGLEQVGIHDDFYALGGDSVRLVQILSRLRESLQVEVGQQIFLTGSITVAKLAKLIAEQRIKRVDTQRIAAKLAELDKLSDEEIKSLLAQHR